MWIALAVLMVFSVAVMLLPLGVVISSTTDGRRWHLIFAGMRIPIPNSMIQSVQAKTGKMSPTQPAKQSRRSVSDIVGRLRRTRIKENPIVRFFELDDLRTVLELTIRLVRSLRIRVRRLHVLIATPNPALTGIAYGMAWAVIGCLPSNWPVSVEADWTTAAPKFSYRVEFSVIPARLLSLVVSILLKKVHAKKTFHSLIPFHYKHRNTYHVESRRN